MPAPASAAGGDGQRPERASERLLRLDFECLESLPGQLREVRTWLDNVTGGEFAGKRMDLSLLESEVLIEPQILQQITHDNVVPILSAARVDGYPSPMDVVEIVMPHHPRGSLTDAMLRGERFSMREACQLIQAALRGLGEIHERHQVVHRDIKSSNLLLADDHTLLKVGDLGLAGRMDPQGRVAMIDNPQLYSPPELVADGYLTRQSDLFSLGLVFVELVREPFPYHSCTRTHIVSRLMPGVSPLRTVDRQLPPWVPRGLKRVITKATARHPGQRYPTARHMSAALANVRVIDWKQIADNRWEAPYLHQPDRRIAVESRTMRSGKIRLSVLAYRSAWRRAQPDTDVEDLYSADAAAVFDQADQIACAR